MSDHNFEQLKEHILNLSDSQNFQVACREWEMVGCYVSETLDECACGMGIKEQCFIKNQITGNETYVGNVCINRFMGIENTKNLFSGLKRITDNLEANTNESVINLATARGVINEKESAFLIDTSRKRYPTNRQINWKIDLNRKIIRNLIAPGRQPQSPADPAALSDQSSNLTELWIEAAISEVEVQKPASGRKLKWP